MDEIREKANLNIKVNSSIIIGIGIGILITTFIIMPFYRKNYTISEIEVEARKLGMIYPDEKKALED